MGIEIWTWLEGAVSELGLVIPLLFHKESVSSTCILRLGCANGQQKASESDICQVVGGAKKIGFRTFHDPSRFDRIFATPTSHTRQFSCFCIRRPQQVDMNPPEFSVHVGSDCLTFRFFCKFKGGMGNEASPPPQKWNWGRGVTPGDLRLWSHFPFYVD